MYVDGGRFNREEKIDDIGEKDIFWKYVFNKERNSEIEYICGGVVFI